MDFSQSFGGPLSGQESKRPVSPEMPLRPGPMNCDQSAATRKDSSPRHREQRQKANIECRTRNDECRSKISTFIIQSSLFDTGNSLIRLIPGMMPTNEKYARGQETLLRGLLGN